MTMATQTITTMAALWKVLEMPYSSETSVTEALSMETRRSISLLDLHSVVRIEELASLKLRIADLLGRRIERALFEESVGI